MSVLSLARRGFAGLILGCLAACGGGGGSPAEAPPPTTVPPTTTLPPASLADLSATVTSPQAGRQINCRTLLRAVVTLSNHGAGAATVTGIEKKSRILQGRCEPAGDFTYRPQVAFVAPGASEKVMDAILYFPGSGCCFPGSACDGRTTCKVQESLVVKTGAGPVPAGTLTYRLNFAGCSTCETTTASRQAGCTRALP